MHTSSTEAAEQESQSQPRAADASIILVAAAIAIPNLMRARIAANESSAVANMRLVTTAQVAYFSTYRDKEFAPDLATLGPDPSGSSFHSSEHASFIDAALGNPNCTSEAWCPKDGYNFRLTGDCKRPALVCKEFVALATPTTSTTGTRSFCSTSDGVIRYNVGPPLISPISPSECRRWAPVQ